MTVTAVRTRGQRALWAVIALVALVGVVMIVSAYLRAPTPPPEPPAAADPTASNATATAGGTATATPTTSASTVPTATTTTTTTPTPTMTPTLTPTPAPVPEPVPPPPPPSPTSSIPSVPAGTDLKASPPTHITIPAIGVDAPTGSVGVDSTGTLEVPPLSEPGLTAWYRLGVTPGEAGNALIVGHVDTQTGPAVFYRLGALKRGDLVKVTRKDGTVAVFVVNTVKLYDKNDLPLDQLYGPSASAQLQLVTCGGPLDGGHHVGNVVASATLQQPV